MLFELEGVHCTGAQVRKRFRAMADAYQYNDHLNEHDKTVLVEYVYRYQKRVPPVAKEQIAFVCVRQLKGRGVRAGDRFDLYWYSTRTSWGYDKFTVDGFRETRKPRTKRAQNMADLRAGVMYHTWVAEDALRREYVSNGTIYCYHSDSVIRAADTQLDHVVPFAVLWAGYLAERGTSDEAAHAMDREAWAELARGFARYHWRHAKFDLVHGARNSVKGARVVAGAWGLTLPQAAWLLIKRGVRSGLLSPADLRYMYDNEGERRPYRHHSI